MISDNQEKNLVLNKLYEEKEKKSTINMLTALINKDIKKFKESINLGADLNVIFNYKDFKNISLLSFLFIQSEENHSLDKKSGFFVESLNYLTKKNIDFIVDNVQDNNKKDNFLFEMFIKKILEKIKKEPELLIKDNSAFWITELLKNKEINTLQLFFKQYPHQKNGVPWAFKLNTNEESLMCLSVQTKNIDIINFFLDGVNKENINIDPSIYTKNNYETKFNLIDEIIANFNNDSDSKKEFYFFVLKDLLNKGAVLNININNTKVEKLILELELQNSNVINKTLKV